MMKRFQFFHQKIFSYLFSWTHRVQLRKLRRKLVGRSLKIFISNTESDKKTTIFSKVFFLFKMLLWLRKKQFWYPYDLVPVGSGKSLTQSPQKMRKFRLFFGKMSFFEMFLWKNRKHFWQPRPKIFAKKLKFSCAVYERFLKNEQFSNWKVLLEIFLSTGRFQFRQTYWNFIGRRRKFFHSIPENVEKTSNFFQKIVFLRNVTIVSLNAVLKTQEVSRQKVEKF